MSDLLPQVAFLCCFQPAVGTTAVELKTQSMIMSVFTSMSMPHQYRSLACPRLYSGRCCKTLKRKRRRKGGKRNLLIFLLPASTSFTPTPAWMLMLYLSACALSAAINAFRAVVVSVFASKATNVATIMYPCLPVLGYGVSQLT